MAPGPGALAVVGGGVRRVRTNVFGRPRATRPAHCSQCAMESSTVLSNVASSASMSCQCGPWPNEILPSFDSTCLFRTKTKLRHIRSKALWFILVRMWIVLKGTLEISSNKAIACTCRECPSGSRVAVNNGCRCWGVTNFWQPLRLQRCRGRPLSRSCSLPKMPLLQIGHDFPSNLGNMPSSIKRRMMPVSLAARSSWILRFHFARSLRSSGEAKFFCTYGVFFHASFFLAAGEEGSCFVSSFQCQETGWNQHRTHCGEMPNQTLEHGRLEAFESKSLTVKGFSRGAPFQRSAAQSLFPSGT